MIHMILRMILDRGHRISFKMNLWGSTQSLTVKEMDQRGNLIKGYRFLDGKKGSTADYRVAGIVEALKARRERKNTNYVMYKNDKLFLYNNPCPICSSNVWYMLNRSDVLDVIEE